MRKKRNTARTASALGLAVRLARDLDGGAAVRDGGAPLDLI
jgi:hypothetical protein